MKKLLFVITKSNWGGAQRYLYDMATELKGSYEVAVALGGEGELAKRLRQSGVTVFSIPSLGRDVRFGDDLKSFFELSSIIKRFKPDIVHLNSSKIGGLGALAARLRKIPHVIFTAHGWAFNEDRSMISKLAIKCAYWVTMSLCTHTIAVSEATWKYVANWPYVGKKISTVRNAVGTIDFMPREEARQKLGATTESWTVGTIAELHPIKGLIYACEAIKECTKSHPDIRYVIIGEGETRTILETYIARNKLEKNITLVGHLSQAARYLKAFDVFILPSLSEGLGYVLLEAGLASLPVIASNVGGIPEIITSGENGLLVPSRDSAALFQALEKIHADTSLAADFGAKLTTKVATDFSLGKMVEKTIPFYN